MSSDLGLLVLRLVVGVLMMGHGAQKLFGWFGGYGLAGVSGYFGSQLRLRPARAWALLAGLSEAVGGLFLALGLLNPLGSLAIIAAMLVAIILVHWPRVWNSDNGSEYLVVLAAVALAVAIAGPGAYSLDAALGLTLPAPASLLIGLVLVALGIATALATRAPEVEQAPVSQQVQQAA
jgi:putative oxidoreductase